MKFLLDTNVVSELRKSRPHRAVLAWLNATPTEDIAVSAIVLGELQGGAEITRKQDPVKEAELDRWIDRVAQLWQVIEIDAAIAREWARLVERRNRSLFEDALIAATARVHGLVIVTRNTRDFETFGVSVLDPFLYGERTPD